ncbi:chemotaxis-specific protein-glutamate methyltransferase CheB [Palleronia sp. KMU-117]|uniref:chemotaxis-specific protein-glutamate methyltransferase CheB n=1 Tax=Palleronia sp. KMU-117 TaxID=3434108 RepID=UPI003D734AAF
MTPDAPAGLTRVLIVDDSRTIRTMLRALLAADPRIAVVGEATDPYEAREAIKALDPDVLTLDVEMPRMNGLDFLGRLMRLRPMPVVMVSTRTTENSETAIRALSIGAVDCIDLSRFRGDAEGAVRLADTLVQAARASVGRLTARPRPAQARPAAAPFQWNGRIVLIGSSTGGVDALERVLAAYPADGPPTLVAQHMPPSFLRSFADRLNAQVAPQVSVLGADALLETGRVYFAPGGDSHGIVVGRDRLRLRAIADDGTAAYVPSVDRLFASAVGVARQVVAVLLTGMGRDGAEAMRDLRAAGAHTIVQSGDSCVIDGMPRAARDLDAAIEVRPLDEIGAAILAATGRAALART